MNRKKKLIVAGILIGFLFFLGDYLGTRMIIEIRNPVALFLKKNFGEKTIVPTPSEFDSTFTYYSHDGLKLSAGIEFPLVNQTKGTIILLHGIRASKAYMSSVAKLLSSKGYVVIVPDHRAHGESEGQYCTFGHKEKADVSSLITYCEGKGILNQPVGVWGQSLGGSIGLQVLASDKRVDFGIIESTYSSFPDVVHQYAERYFGFDPYWLSEYLIYRSGKVADFPSTDLDISLICKKISQPVFMAHGTADKNIPFSSGQKNFQALRGEPKIFYSVKGAGHNNLWEVGGPKYFTSALSFIEDNFIRQTP